MDPSSTRRRIVAWALVIVFSAVLPFTRNLWNALQSRAGGMAKAFPLLCGLLLIGVIVALLLRRRERRAGVYIALLAVGVLYALTFRSVARPVEKLHIAEYAFLAFLLCRAMAYDLRGPLIYLWVGLVGFQIGIMDELAQGLLRDRFFDIRDIRLNGWSIFLGLLVVSLVLRPGGRK